MKDRLSQMAIAGLVMVLVVVIALANKVNSGMQDNKIVSLVHTIEHQGDMVHIVTRDADKNEWEFNIPQSMIKADDAQLFNSYVQFDLDNMDELMIQCNGSNLLGGN